MRRSGTLRPADAAVPAIIAARNDWIGDDAHAAVEQWNNAWRTVNVEQQPPLLFGLHLGREAVVMQKADVPRMEMLRLFAASGYDNVCICGKPIDDIVTGMRLDAANGRHSSTPTHPEKDTA